MTTKCTCGTCGDAHDPKPAMDWTHYERDVLAYVDLWLSGVEAALAAIREGRELDDPSRLDEAERRVIAYFPTARALTYTYVYGNLEAGKVYLSKGGGRFIDIWRVSEGVIWPAHAIRPDGA